MKIAERKEACQVPAWAVDFLCGRSDQLQRRLAHHADPVVALSEEEDSLHCWMVLLGSATDLSPGDRHRLEELHLLHARVAERIERGGVADISWDVEQLVRAVLCEQLDRMTAEVVHHLR